MPIRLRRQFFRERRRVTLVVVLTFAAVQLVAPAALAQAGPATGIALGLGAVFAGVALLAPALRGYAEAVAVAGLAFAGLVRVLPGSPLDLGGPTGSLPVALGVLLGLVALIRGARSGLAALPLPCLGPRRFKARAVSHVDIDRLWYGLVPSPGQAARCGDPDLPAIDDMSLRRDRVRLVTPDTPDLPRVTDLQILEVDAPFHIRLRASDGDGRGLMGATGVSEIFLVDLGTRRLVLFAHDFPQLPLGRAILAWLDDAPGRMLDRRLAAIERRAGTETTGGPAPDVRPAGRPFPAARGTGAVAPARRLANRKTPMSRHRKRKARNVRISPRD